MGMLMNRLEQNELERKYEEIKSKMEDALRTMQEVNKLLAEYPEYMPDDDYELLNQLGNEIESFRDDAWYNSSVWC